VQQAVCRPGGNFNLAVAHDTTSQCGRTGGQQVLAVQDGAPRVKQRGSTFQHGVSLQQIANRRVGPASTGRVTFAVLGDRDQG